jgi:hypothetical protein
MDTVNNVSLCGQSFYAALYPEKPATSYTYAWLGDKVLMLSYDTLTGFGLGDWGATYNQYFVSSAYSINPLSIRNPSQLTNRSATDFKVWQSATGIQATINLSRPSPVSFAIYSMSGRLIQRMPERYLQAGKYRYTFDVPALRSGCYLLVMKKGQEINSLTFNYVSRL